MLAPSPADEGPAAQARAALAYNEKARARDERIAKRKAEFVWNDDVTSSDDDDEGGQASSRCSSPPSEDMNDYV